MLFLLINTLSKVSNPCWPQYQKALNEADLNKLLSYKPTTADKQKAIDFWLFSYLCNGMNFADIIELKPENISDKYLHFIRAKTKRTKKKDIRPIRVGLNPKAQEIINRQKIPMLQTLICFRYWKQA